MFHGTEYFFTIPITLSYPKKSLHQKISYVVGHTEILLVNLKHHSTTAIPFPFQRFVRLFV
jgi:hypothetical protein